MGEILELEESSFLGYIEEGTPYAARVVDVKIREKPFTDERTGEKVRRLEFHFKLVSDDEHDGQDIWGDTSTRFNDHPECKLKQWAEHILGQRLPAGYRLDTDTLVNQECRVIVGKKEWEKDGSTKIRNLVRDVFPTKAAMARLRASDDEEF